MKCDALLERFSDDHRLLHTVNAEKSDFNSYMILRGKNSLHE